MLSDFGFQLVDQIFKFARINTAVTLKGIAQLQHDIENQTNEDRVKGNKSD